MRGDFADVAGPSNPHIDQTPNAEVAFQFFVYQSYWLGAGNGEKQWCVWYASVPVTMITQTNFIVINNKVFLP